MSHAFIISVTWLSTDLEVSKLPMSGYEVSR